MNRDTAGRTLLTLNDGAKTTGLTWKKLTADITTADLPMRSCDATRVTLMENEKGIDFGMTYDRGKGETRSDFEFVIDTDSGTKAATRYVYVDDYRFKGNKTATYADTDGTHESAWGGRSEPGNTAEGNVLTMTGGTITDTAYGAVSRRGAAKSNQLIMRGGEAQTLKGGFGASASDNTVELFGGKVKGDVYGGHATAGAAANNVVHLRAAVTVGGAMYGGKASVESANNTLAAHTFGAQAADFANVQNLHFFFPAGTTPAETRTMLTLTNAGEKNIQGLNLGVGTAGDAKVFKEGDAVSILIWTTARTATAR